MFTEKPAGNISPCPVSISAFNLDIIPDVVDSQNIGNLEIIGAVS